MNFPSQKLFFFFIPVVVGLALFVTIRNHYTNTSTGTQDIKVVSIDNTQNIEIKELDTDEDGVPDWEEGLWNTDPAKKNSNPEKIADRAYIDKKKQSGQEKNISKDEVSIATAKNKTEALGKVIFTEYLALKQAGRVDPNTVNQMTARIADDVALSMSSDPQYGPSSIRIIKSDEQSLKKYADTIALIRDKYFSGFASSQEDGHLLFSGSTEQVQRSLLLAGDYYKKMTNELLAVPVPDSIATLHLELINNYKSSAENLNKVSIVDEDPLSTMLGLKKYEDLSEKEVGILKKMALSFAESGILFTNSDPAFLIWGTS